MKKLALALLILPPTAIFAASNNPNPSDFTLTVRIISSATETFGITSYQVLETVIDNQSIELQTRNKGILNPGDYKARLSTSIHGPTDAHSYDIYRGYDLLMPDGTTRTYTVTRLGPAPTNP